MDTLAYKKAVNSTWLIGIASILIMPDAIFGLLFEITHLLLELLHLAFELFESALDHWVEHTFHTGTRETQLIVFYLMMTMAAGGLYFLWGVIQRQFQMLKNKLLMVFLCHKNRLSIYWAESATNKFKLIAGFNAALTFVYLFGF
jgi:hypothetical protein